MSRLTTDARVRCRWAGASDSDRNRGRSQRCQPLPFSAALDGLVPVGRTLIAAGELLSPRPANQWRSLVVSRSAIASDWPADREGFLCLR